MPRRHGILVVLALVLGVLVIGAAPASAAVPADGTYISCTGSASAPTQPYYVMAGGAPLQMTLSDMPTPGKTSGTPTTANVTYHSDCATLFPTAKVPKNGTFIRGYRSHAATGANYEIIGGAPIRVTHWANVMASGSGKVIPVDADVIPAATATTDRTTMTLSGKSVKLHGYLHAKVAANTKFAGFDTTTKKPGTYYSVDASHHPVPQAAATSGEVSADQTSINACERMDCDPSGVIVNEYGAGDGVLHVDGWAADYPSPASVRVQLSLGGSAYVVPANRPTNYVAAGTAGNHGFSVNLAVAAGSYVLCGTVLGTAPGASTQPLGCSNVTVGGSAPGRVHRPKVKAKGSHRLVVRWKQPATHGSPIAAYVVKTSTGKKKQVRARKHKIVLKHLPAGARVHVKVRAINGVAAGRFSKPSKTVTVR